MNRRGFMKSVIGASVVGLGGQNALAEVTRTERKTKEEPDEKVIVKVVDNSWEAVDSGNTPVTMFSTKITSFTLIRLAEDYYRDFEEMADDGKLNGEHIGFAEGEEIYSNESYKTWEAFFMEEKNPFETTHYAYAFYDNLVYEFKWVFVGSGHRRAYQVFKSVMNRSTNAYQEEPMRALLPTQEEMDEIGSYELVEIGG